MKQMRLVIADPNGKDTRSSEEICDEIDYESSSLGYISHRTIQDDLCELLNRLKLVPPAWWKADAADGEVSL